MIEVIFGKGRAVLIYDASQHVDVKAIRSTTLLALAAADGICTKYNTASDHADTGNNNVWHRCSSTGDRRRFCDLSCLGRLHILIRNFHLYGINFKRWTDDPFSESRDVQF